MEDKRFDNLRKQVSDLGNLNTLFELYSRVKTYEDRVFTVERIEGKEITHTYNDFTTDVKKLAAYFITNNISKKRIAIVAKNSYYWIVSLFAITCSGNIAVPIDKELTDRDINRLLKESDINHIFFSKEYFDNISFCLNKNKSIINCICFEKEKKEDKILFLDDLLKAGEKCVEVDIFKDISINRDDDCFIIFTSGSTGSNKGVILSHGNVTQNVNSICAGYHNVHSCLSILPMNHMFELGCDILPALYMGLESLYINDSFRNLSKNIKEYKPDVVVVVPLIIDTIYNSIWQTAKRENKLAILKNSIKISNLLLKIGIDIRNILFKNISEKFGGSFPLLVCGGAPSREDYTKFLCDIGFKIQIGYGLTEASPVVTLNLDARKNPASVGKPFINSHYIIKNPKKDGSGEIWIKGGNVTKGYCNDEEANISSFQNGWFKTGDEGKTDKDGNLYIVGRKKNLIILDNGKNIYPDEIEELFKNTISYIKEIIVFEATKKFGETNKKIIAAVINIKHGHKKDIDEDIDYVNNLLPVYKRIQDFYISNDDFELTGVGKINRAKVIQRYYDKINNEGEEVNNNAREN
ncbi:MAG: AMP-binding protein [Bacilli bacterium]|nr:AMP-binding protein [Bacilli bacterium]